MTDKPAKQEKKEAKKEPEADAVAKVINLCQRRGLIFPSGEIYGTLAGFFDYGPYGAQFKRNLENLWWNHFVRSREDIVGMEGSIITHPSVWKASGHVDSFNDPLVDCTKCGLRSRADHLVEDELKISVDGLSIKHLQELIEKHKVVCPKCKGRLSPVRVFGLMFKTSVGATSEAEDKEGKAIAYLRPETAQLIFADFKQIQLVSRKALPFGIAQIGKSFRNEIAPRNFVFRCREFSQMEVEYFIHPQQMNDCALLTPGHLDTKILFFTQKNQEDKTSAQVLSVRQALDAGIIGTRWHAYWLAECFNWLASLGLRRDKLRARQHLKDELSHYSSETWDLEFEYPWGWKELQGIANRGSFDLTQHSKHSGKDISYFDQAANQRITPFVIEPSWGLDRLLFTLLINAYYEKPAEKEGAEPRTMLRLAPSIAPVQVAVFPLVNKEALPAKARDLFEQLRLRFACEYDDSGSIGRRYARQDEIGTPYCITVDFQTIEDGTVTLRERDSGKQERVKAVELVALLAGKIV